MLIGARPSHWVPSIPWEAAFASRRTGDVTSARSRTPVRDAWNDVSYLLPRNDTHHDALHLAWLCSASNSSPRQLFYRQNKPESLTSGFCSVGERVQNLALIIFYFFLGLLICKKWGDGYQSLLPSGCLHLHGMQTADGMFKTTGYPTRRRGRTVCRGCLSDARLQKG